MVINGLQLLALMLTNLGFMLTLSYFHYLFTVHHFFLFHNLEDILFSILYSIICFYLSVSPLASSILFSWSLNDESCPLLFILHLYFIWYLYFIFIPGNLFYSLTAIFSINYFIFVSVRLYFSLILFFKVTGFSFLFLILS